MFVFQVGGVFPEYILDVHTILLHTPLKQRFEIDFKQPMSLSYVGTHFTHKSIIHNFKPALIVV